MAKKAPNNEQLLEKLDSGFASLDEQRAIGLYRMNDAQALQATMLKKEQARLMKKYSADHPKVMQIAERLSYKQGLQSELDREIEKAKIVVPELDANTWIVHGRVLTTEGEAISGLTVALYDEHEQWATQLGQSRSDEFGYFVLRYTKAKTDRSPLSDSQKLFLTVSKAEQTLYQATEPLYKRLGSIDYRVIVIQQPNESCPPTEKQPHLKA